jgi:hypothetical protein
MTHIQSKIYSYPEYMFSMDWFTHNIPIWHRFFTDNNLYNKPSLKCLEIGSFEGRSTVYLLDHVLTDPESSIDVIDTFDGSAHEEGMKGLNLNNLLDCFKYNTRHHSRKVNILQGPSNKVLPTLDLVETYDIIYIDGSHRAQDVLFDAVLCHRLLKQYGLLIFDDYLWEGNTQKYHRPKIAIDAFISTHENLYEILWSDYQVICKKLESNHE